MAVLICWQRLHESDAQVAALLSGFAAVVPVQLFPLFTADEMEQLICGRPDFEIDQLKVPLALLVAVLIVLSFV